MTAADALGDVTLSDPFDPSQPYNPDPDKLINKLWDSVINRHLSFEIAGDSLE